jgi:hypothetical protein
MESEPWLWIREMAESEGDAKERPHSDRWHEIKPSSTA